MLKFYEDPGHGWLAVPVSEYPDALDYGSGYGYVGYDANGAYVAYLEEDLELALFLKAHPEVDFKSVPVVYHEDNRVRGLPSIGEGKAFKAYVASKRGK